MSDPGQQDVPDPLPAQEVAGWRRAKRTRLLAARQQMSAEARKAASEALATHVAAFVAKRFGDVTGRRLSVYWPIRSEPDLRSLLHLWHGAGAEVALPVVEVKFSPLVFRRWLPDVPMVRGDWNIPVPAPSAPRMVPEVALAPLVGWDARCYRLGYGGGYFDRTLAALSPRPFVIGVGYQFGRLATIHPQPHDIALDAIMTEEGLQAERG